MRKVWFLLMLGLHPAFAQNSILTRSVNNYRTGANLNETVFTPAAILQQGLRTYMTLNLPGDARGTEAQPLIVAGVLMGDGFTHNVLYTNTMDNNVFAFDADYGTMLWEQHIGNPIPDIPAIDTWMIQDHWGSLSTGVINPATSTYYVMAMSSSSTSITDAKFYLHGLSLFDGHDQFPPIDMSTASYTSPNGFTSKFNEVPRKQRPGLLFDSRNGHDTVFIAFGAFNEDANTNRGFIIAVDTTNLKPRVSAAITTTSKYSGAGIWQSGQGLTMNASGDLFGITGNGAFDGNTEFGNAFIRVHYTPPTSNTTNGSFTFNNWFAPFNDVSRVGYSDQTLADTSLIPNGGYANIPGGASNMDSPKDEDLGSAGALLLPASDASYSNESTHYTKDVLLGAGKDGILYVLDANNLGKNTNLDFNPNLIVNNVYSHLLSPAYGFTYYPGAMNLEPTILDQIQTTYGGYTHHQHSSPVYYNSPILGPMLFTGGENGTVRAYTFNSDFTLTYRAQGSDVASANVPPPGGMPGSMLTISTNGKTPNSCVLWAIQPVGNANTTITAGYLLAYECDTFNNGNLIKIYDSRTAGPGQLNFMFDKFDIPTPINGKLYLPTYNGTIIVLGLQ